MPLIAWLVAAYLAGSLAGFTAGASAVAATASCAAIAAALISRPRLAAACILVVAGSLAARGFQGQQRSCAARAVGADEVTLTLIDDASPGSFARARLACGARASTFIAKGKADAGSTARVRGLASISSDVAAINATSDATHSPTVNSTRVLPRLLMP